MLIKIILMVNKNKIIVTIQSAFKYFWHALYSSEKK